jgi:protein ImuB
VAPGDGGGSGEGGGPLWLLSRPEPLELRDGSPWHHGRLEIGPEPQRIESGWWHGADQARDYYIARTAAGERLWIYRERRAPGRWLLHGIFG